MYRPSGDYTSFDDNGIPGLTLTSYAYVAGSTATAAPGLSGVGTAALALILLILGRAVLHGRHRAAHLPRPAETDHRV